MKHVSPQETTVEYIKFASIIAGILLLSIISAQGDYSYLNVARWVMGWFFVIFASFKLLGYQMFVAMFPTYDIVAKRSKIYTRLYPFIEGSLGLLYLFNVLPIARNAIAIAVMGVGLVGVTRHVRTQGQIPCACLGNVIKLPVGRVTFIEDGAMLIMAVLMLAIRL